MQMEILLVGSRNSKTSVARAKWAETKEVIRVAIQNI